MLTFIIFIIVISVLVFVHEAGHFLFAKRAGMRVDEFGFGFPPRLWGFKKGDTIYSINWIPFGGFVKIHGEDGGHRSEADSFGSKSITARLKVVLAGVVMNFLFAALLLTVGNYLGLRIGLFTDAEISSATNKAIQVIEVVADSPAQKAGVEILDSIVGFRQDNGSIFTPASVKDVQDFILSHAGKTVTIVMKRPGQVQVFEYPIHLRALPPPGQGPLGVSLALTGVIAHPWYVAIWKGIYDAVLLTINTVLGYWMLLQKLFVSGKLGAEVSGPIGIATLTGQAARVGFSYLLQFIALISVNLAVLNVLPFPALDGGRALMLIIEKVRRKPLDKKIEGTINAIGFAVLLILMVLVTIKDISKYL